MEHRRRLNGFPTAVGSFAFTIQVNDTVGQVAQRQCTFNVLTTGPIVVTPTQLSFTCRVGRPLRQAPSQGSITIAPMRPPR